MKNISDHTQEITDNLSTCPPISVNNDNIFIGFTNIEQITKGFKKGELILIGSRPSVGKSTLGLQIALNASNLSNNSILIFSLELTAKNITKRLISYLSHRSPYSNNEIYSIENLACIKANVAELSDRLIYIDDSSKHTVNDIIYESKKFLNTSKIDLIIIDYLQLINFGEIKNIKTDRENSIKSLKLLAQELDCPIIILSQLDNSIESRSEYRPLLKNITLCEDVLDQIDHIILISEKKFIKNKIKKEYFCDLNIYSKKNSCHTLKRTKLAWNEELSVFENTNDNINNFHSTFYNPSKFSFERFITNNDSSVFSKNLCIDFCKQSNEVDNFNIFITGDFGLGKSHLIQSIYNQINQTQPDKKTALLNALDLTDELVNSIRINKYKDFIKKFTEEFDILLIDDIHTLTNKTASQETLSIILDFYIINGKQIVLTSAYGKDFLHDLNLRLKSQIEQLISIKLTPPDLKACYEIVVSFCDHHCFKLEDSVINYIIESTEHNPRQLEGKIAKIMRYCSDLNDDLSIDKIKELID